MRTSKFSPEQMVHILRQGDSGVRVVALCTQHGVSEQTYFLEFRRDPQCLGRCHTCAIPKPGT